MRCGFLVFAILIASTLVLGSPSMGSSKQRILPFKVWKQKKIDEAKSVVSELRRQNKRSTQVKIDDQEDPEKQDSAQKLSQAELNLGVARELSANDYFLLYVAPQFKNNNEALVQAAKALTPHDIADILTAYEKKIQTADAYSNAESAPQSDEVPVQEKTAKAP